MRHAFDVRQRASFPTTTDNTSGRRTPTELRRQPGDALPPMTSVSVETIAASDLDGPGDCDEVGANETPVDLGELFPEARFYGGEVFSVTNIAHDASMCGPGDVVIYRTGEGDPNELIADALARGAAGLISEQLLPCPIPQCVVGNVDHALAKIAARQNDRPDRKLLTVGVLGQNGKTSSCLLMATLTTALGIRTAYQCDLGSSDGVVNDSPSRAIPVGADMIRWLAESGDCMSRVAIMEIDEKAARAGHYDAIQFDVLVVTGKSELSDDFGPCGLASLLERLTATGIVIAPQCDIPSLELLESGSAQIIGYGTTADSEFSAISIDQSGGMSTLMLCAGDTSAMVETPLCGQAMAANIAAATALGALLGHSPHEIGEHLSTLRTIPGRGQRLIEFGQATVVLETGGSVERVTEALRTAKASGAGGRVWCVMAIGESDADDELANYGHMIERFADHSVVTSHPNQTAEFLKRSHQVLDGVRECAAVRLVADQKRAIQWAMESCKPRDTVVVVLNRRGQTPFAARTELAAIEEIVGKTRAENPATYVQQIGDAGLPIKLKLFR